MFEKFALKVVKKVHKVSDQVKIIKEAATEKVEEIKQISLPSAGTEINIPGKLRNLIWKDVQAINTIENECKCVISEDESGNSTLRIRSNKIGSADKLKVFITQSVIEKYQTHILDFSREVMNRLQSDGTLMMISEEANCIVQLGIWFQGLPGFSQIQEKGSSEVDGLKFTRDLFDGKWIVYGLPKNCNRALQLLNELSRSGRQKHSLDDHLCSLLEDLGEERRMFLELQLRKYDLTLIRARPKQYQLVGNPSFIEKGLYLIATTTTEGLKIKPTQRFNDLPPLWTRGFEDQVFVWNLTSDYPYYFKIADKFNQTLPHSQIKSIQVIQNMSLWTMYSSRRELVIQKYKDWTLDGPVEKYLFHGTSNTDPALVFNGEQGFDFRYSRDDCVWGRANYFAVNASYSQAYSFPLKSGYRQMFCARVCVGYPKIMDPDSSLKMPPLIEANDPTMRHETVQGYTNGSVVYMTYENALSYPEFLITYKP
mmetsp:Transcript_1974/g.2066  ORF Transcript_1974/g.2066 Transcript_1974/m.2066 type:complete len:482 (-) Transcript_1974:127-1572(-)|eukprot:CAMPEP_0115007474 /NCGR_PEP_ID=MMETSP0216-20121206/21209_1 /TAXON_ID=223996 /ORGANISM="Protocruzia adherens, Strain Boccale" /LENGTH=481 /DNA_ID=CAMNT_0002374439 /DNA_START=42 /DNA_END=1487 /DNA_ORIENTATION=-